MLFNSAYTLLYMAATRIEHQTFTLLREGAAVKSGSSFWQKITVITKKIFFKKYYTSLIIISNLFSFKVEKQLNKV